jgi:hypothetical protein
MTGSLIRRVPVIMALFKNLVILAKSLGLLCVGIFAKGLPPTQHAHKRI